MPVVPPDEVPRALQHALLAVAEVLVWDRALSDEELLDASEYLRREVLGVAPAPAPLKAPQACAMGCR